MKISLYYLRYLMDSFRTAPDCFPILWTFIRVKVTWCLVCLIRRTCLAILSLGAYSIKSINRHRLGCRVYQGFPTLGPQTGTGVRSHSRSGAAGKEAKLHLYLQLLPLAHITTRALPPISTVILHSHRSLNPTVTCLCKKSRLCAPLNHPETITHLPSMWWKFVFQE